MRVLSLVEQLMLVLDKSTQPMHVGGLFIFSLPQNADDQFAFSLYRQMKTSVVQPVAPFNQKLYRFAFWKSVSQLDTKRHVYYKLLSKVEGKQQLLDYIAQLHAKSLDKKHPLWECHIIDFDDKEKGFGLYFKIHHALVDGVAAMRLVEKSLFDSAYEKSAIPIWALITRNPHYRHLVKPIKRNPFKVISQQINTVKPVANKMISNFLQRGAEDYVKTTQAPKSILNQPITQNRKFITTTFQLSRFKKIANKLSYSVNDIALAICSGALRQYLIALDQLPNQPLIAFVPVSLRQDDSLTGNQASLVLCNLGTHLTSPMKRLALIHKSVKRGKNTFNKMSQAEVINYSAANYAWEGINLLTNIYPEKQAFNLIISNVSGPTNTLYWNGAKLQSITPASVLFDGQALNITLISYSDQIDFGIVACHDVLPQTHMLSELLNRELKVLEDLSNLPPFER